MPEGKSIQYLQLNNQFRSEIKKSHFILVKKKIIESYFWFQTKSTLQSFGALACLNQNTPKLKHFLTTLRLFCFRNGTSFVSLYIPAGDQLNKHMSLLTQELAGAESIKSRQTRQSVISAITSAREKLKLYKNIPASGLVIFCGIILMEDGHTERKIKIALEPFRPINVFSYRCQNSFETEPLLSLLEDDDKFGFIIIDGNGVLFATLQGNNKEIIQRMPVQLPKKHGRGGQSAVRFARLREEKRHLYIVKCCELATQHFIANDRANIRGIVVAGSADLKFVMQ